MKICAIVAEYNPFHLGHLHQIDYVKNTLNAEKIVVIMSGAFSQRGEICLLNKFTRAKHAIIAGADLVIELPTVFATANAEVFATGAINILNSLGAVDGLCFGVESGSSEEYLALAKAMLSESKEFKRALKTNLEQGNSLAKSKFLAVKEVFGDVYNEQLINSPNNVLGLEYTKAILKNKSNIEIFPLVREGDHNDTKLKKGVTSASSIRLAVKEGLKRKAKPCLPKYVYNDLKDYPYSFDKLCMAKLLISSPEQLKGIMDCTEGLENRIKALSKDNRTVDALVDKVTTKRYPSTRIRRILTSNLLEINAEFVRECLGTNLYAKVLAVSSQSLDLLSELSKTSKSPILTRKSDLAMLKKTAISCFQKDVLANDLYNLVCDEKTNEHYMLIV